MKQVIELGGETPQWNEFLAQHEHFVFHTPQFYAFLKKTFAQKPLYLAVVDGQKITLLLPAVHINHPLFGKKIISMGYLEYGGFAGEKEDVQLILGYLKRNYSQKVSFVEIRQGLEQFDDALLAQTVSTTPYKRFILPLGSVESVWKSIQKHKRKAIKKSEEDGVFVRELNAGDIDSLYALYLRDMRSFGSPPYAKHFFSNFLSSGIGKIFGAFMNNTLIAALAGYCYQKCIHIIISVSDEKYLIHRPNDAVHWAFIKHGCENGFSVFDFGRTREGSGQHEYKEKFGGVMQPLNHYYLLFGRKDIPLLDPNDSKMKLATAAWKYLPLSATEKLGPWLREGLGI